MTNQLAEWPIPVIVEASDAEDLNLQLNGCTDDWIAIQRAGYELSSEAGSSVAAVLEAWPNAAFIYGDLLSKVSANSGGPPLPDWSPMWFLGNFYTGGCLLIRRDAAIAAGGFNTDAGNAQLYDLALRLMESGGPVVRTPIALSRRLAGEDNADIADDERQAVQSHCDRRGRGAIVEHGPVAGLRQIIRKPPAGLRASIIIPTAGTWGDLFGENKCMVINAVRSILAHDYAVDFEIVIVADDRGDLSYLAELVSVGGSQVRVVMFDKPFNFAEKVNIGTLGATSDVLIFVNDDTQVISPRWLDQLCALAMESDVGAVGPKLMYPSGAIQQAGMVLRTNPWWIENADTRRPDTGGRLGHRQLDHDVVAVTGAALATRRSVYLDLGGMCESFPGAFNDVDYCFKAITAGLRNISANSVSMYHFESMSREGYISDRDQALVFARWKSVVRDDPYLRYAGSTRPGHRPTSHVVATSLSGSADALVVPVGPQL